MKNLYEVKGGTVEILVGARTAYISTADIPKIRRVTLTLYPYKNTHYARSGKNDGRKFLHQLLVDIPKGHRVVFKDGNGLNCTRANMVVLPRGQEWVFDPMNGATQREAEKALAFGERYGSSRPLGGDFIPAKTPTPTVGILETAIEFEFTTVEAELKVLAEMADKGEIPQSGVKGVTWHKATSKWAATVFKNGQRYCLGYHKTVPEASQKITDFNNLACWETGRC